MNGLPKIPADSDAGFRVLPTEVICRHCGKAPREECKLVVHHEGYKASTEIPGIFHYARIISAERLTLLFWRAVNRLVDKYPDGPRPLRNTEALW